MIGRDDSLQTLGIIPCAISWLFKLINERKEKTGARFSVRVSAVEVTEKNTSVVIKSKASVMFLSNGKGSSCSGH